MTLSWTESKTETTPDAVVGEREQYILHKAVSTEVNEGLVQQAVNASVLKAAQLMGDNIDDNSLYLLCDWCMASSTLTLVVTDDRKQQDSVHVVKCEFNTLDLAEEQKDDFADLVRYWISNYLTTSSEFMQFSLVAAFTRDARAKIELL